MTKKTETLEEFLARGGEIKKAETPTYVPKPFTRFRMNEKSESHRFNRWATPHKKKKDWKRKIESGG